MPPIALLLLFAAIATLPTSAAEVATVVPGAEPKHRLAELRPTMNAINPIGEIQFSKDGSQVAALEIYNNSTVVHAIHVWDTATYKELVCIKEVGNPILTFAIAPDAKRIVTGGRDGQLSLWEIPSGKKIWSLERQHSGKNGSGINALSFSNDGTTIASSGRDKNIVIRDAATGLERQHVTAGQEEGFGQAVFSADGHMLACAGGWNKEVFIWEIPSGKLLFTLQGHKLPVFQAMFIQEGKQLVSGASAVMGQDNVEILVWDLATGQQVQKLKYGTGAGIEMALWPDGKYLTTWQGQVHSAVFAGFEGQTLSLLDLNGGNGQALSLPGVPVPAYGLAFSLNGKFMANGTVNGAVTLWDLQGIAADPSNRVPDWRKSFPDAKASIQKNR